MGRGGEGGWMAETSPLLLTRHLTNELLQSAYHLKLPGNQVINIKSNQSIDR